ncbi:MAG: undecaprenyldiphospho-muramoylpentapeptide beta-N-acetylglucosaminyltransferase [Akkermansiaceae bacterium]|nr:undecaprenyldiphospho-muramoylpentapeptide beta-N-acetylglucosaminyltransferase [Akkermansiaceae bacterium]
MGRERTVVIACGGTGGHLFPGIAVAEELQRRGHEVLLLISEKKVDAEASAKYAGLDFKVIPAIAKPPTLSPKMLPFLLRLWKTVRRCKAMLVARRADAVIGMGGFTSLPPVYAGHRLGLPTYVHDSNALPGKSNRLTGRFCTKTLLGLEAAVQYFKGRETEVTGTPVRSEMLSLPTKYDALQKFGMDAGRPVVLVVGGSQGAQGLNTIVLEASKEIGADVQWLHVAGRGDFDRVSKEAEGLEHHVVTAFCDDMPAAYAAADLVVCRSGASSLTELSRVGLPGVLVPYPYAADDHQTKNADAFVAGGGAVLMAEKDLSGASLAVEVKGLVSDQVKMASMIDGMRSMAVDDAAARICDVIEGGMKG